MSIKIEGGSVKICNVLEQTMEECKPGCTKFFDAYNACVTRLGPEAPKDTNCQLQYFDYYRCLDRCVPNKLFAKLK